MALAWLVFAMDDESDHGQKLTVLERNIDMPRFQHTTNIYTNHIIRLLDPLLCGSAHAI
jgi:hypothetical protein